MSISLRYFYFARVWGWTFCFVLFLVLISACLSYAIVTLLCCCMRQSWRWRFPSTLRIPTPVSLFFVWFWYYLYCSTSIACPNKKCSIHLLGETLFLFFPPLVFKFSNFGWAEMMVVCFSHVKDFVCFNLKKNLGIKCFIFLVCDVIQSRQERNSGRIERLGQSVVQQERQQHVQSQLQRWRQRGFLFGCFTGRRRRRSWP